MIAVDVMGGDYAPHEIIEGALKAARSGVPIILFGDTLKIGIALSTSDRLWHRLPITIHHCSQAIEMTDDPIKAVHDKQDSSLVQATKAVARGTAAAVVSAGNSGATLACATVFLGKIPGLLRPAIGGFLPTVTDSAFCMDLGANIECKPEHLVQFALMGKAYVQAAKGLEVVRIGLLANGAEQGKGTKLVQSAYALLQKTFLTFVGNCEPHAMLNGAADVVVCDGFTGNLMLKSMEATIQVVQQLVRNENNKSLLARFASFCSIPLLKKLKKHLKRGQRGGALLLGVTRPVIIAHGASRADAIADAICFAHEVVKQSLYEKFIQNFTAILVSDQMLDIENIRKESALQLSQ